MTPHIPNHLAIIPDGNRRWAKKKSLLVWDGHKKGEEKFREITQAAFELGVSWVTLWAASEDNLRKRTADEISFLARIFADGLAKELKTERFRKERIRFRVVGRWREILQERNLPEPVDLKRLIKTLEDESAGFAERNLTILFGNNDARESFEAMSAIAEKKLPFDEKNFRQALATGFLPDVDLVLRTGEDMDGWLHNSAGFLMWQCANAEYCHTKTLWPDFSKKELAEVLESYAKRRRLHGA